MRNGARSAVNVVADQRNAEDAKLGVQREAFSRLAVKAALWWDILLVLKFVLLIGTIAVVVYTFSVLHSMT